MIPYLHLGPLELPTFGLMVALALIASAYVLQADFDRRGMNADAFTMITVAGLAGIFGAKLYHLLIRNIYLIPNIATRFSPTPFPLLFSRYGFAWFGGFLGGFRGHGVDGMAGEIEDLGIFGCVFAGGLDWVWNWADGLLSFRGWRLWEADFAALGNEFSEWGSADDGTGASDAAV